MNKARTFKWSAALIAALLLAGCCTPCQSRAASKEKLGQLKQKIADVRAHIGSDKASLDKQQNLLAEIEQHLAGLNQAMTNNTKQLNQIQQQLTKLSQQNTTLQQQLNQQQQLLAEQIASNYRLGHQPLLKILLGNTKPSDVQRFFTYYKIINQQRIDTINQFKTTISQLDDNVTTIEQHQLQRQALQKKHQQEKQQYQASLKKRQRLINGLNSSINTRQRKLQRLLANQRALSRAIASASKRARVATTYSGSFIKSKGRMPWPIPGNMQQRFGTSINNSQLKRDGVVIKAQAGQAVHAIADGKVIFAKWMAGYGLLIIIDHGNGYMTLYGRNQTLTKNVGDTVRAGQTIATVGRSGGYQQTGLYFAIRHNAKPLNPSQWCQKA